MQHGDDNRRGYGNNYRRQQFHDRNQNYSPSTSYNYNPAGTGSGGNYGQQRHQQHPHRRPDRFRREGFGNSERVLRQNDQIIQLLREISNKLSAIGGLSPEPAAEPHAGTQPQREPYPEETDESSAESRAQPADEGDEMAEEEAAEEQEIDAQEGPGR